MASDASTSYCEKLIRCARADCLQLTEMMRRKLPAELRDLVYHYLLVEERPIPVGPYYHFRKYNGGITGRVKKPFWESDECDNESDDEELSFEDDYVVLPDGRLKHDHSHTPPSDMVLPNSHVLNPRYVGEAFWSEAQEVYYANNTFCICNLENAIETFLYQPKQYSSIESESPHLLDSSEDPRRKSLFVPAESVRNLQIRIKFEDFASMIPFDATTLEKCVYEQYVLRHVSLHALESLMQRSHQGELNIEFVIMTELSRFASNQSYGPRFVNFLEAIRRTVYITMYDREGTTVKVTHHDEINWPFPRDLTGLFALTKAQWEQVSKSPRFIPVLILPYSDRSLD